MLTKSIFLLLLAMVFIVPEEAAGIAAVNEAVRVETPDDARKEFAARNYSLYTASFTGKDGGFEVFLNRMEQDSQLELVFTAFKWLTTGSILPHGVIVYVSDHFYVGSGWINIDANASLNEIRNFVSPETGSESVRQAFILKDATRLGIIYSHTRISFADFEQFLARLKYSSLLVQAIEYAHLLSVFVFPSLEESNVIQGSRFIVINARASEQAIVEFMCGKDMQSCKIPGL